MKTLEISTAISFKNILFLTDFTEASKTAQNYALSFARKFQARLYPAHVVEPFMVGEIESEVTPEILKEVEAQKGKGLALLFEGAGVNCKELVAQGSIEAVVPAWTIEHGIDLIVTGTHGRKGVNRFFLGSTAETIFRAANCPVLTVGPNVKLSPQSDFKFKKILFATSLTKEAEPALDYALSFAHERDAKLTVLHVVPNDIEVDPDPGVAAEVALQRLRKLAPEEADLVVADGDPAKKILEYARREAPDLIVLGLSKEQKTSTHFQRGIAYKVISQASCAVLTVR